MNLQDEVRKELWEAIEDRYKSKNFSHAIVDAWIYLRDLIRDKSNLDGDGQKLIGLAFGGDTPILKLNSLQTESERNEQKGFEFLLRGIFQGLRNPRSHEKRKDSKENTDAIVLFINYLSKIIDVSEEQFTIDKFLLRVLDPDFVESEKYAKLLGSEVPENKIFDTVIAVYRSREKGNPRKVKYIFNQLSERLDVEQEKLIYKIISEDFNIIRKEKSIRTALGLLKYEKWLNIDEISRLRIETILLSSIKSGKYDFFADQTGEGSLGTWAGKFLRYFQDQYKIRNIIIRKFIAGGEERDYVIEYFIYFLQDLFVTKVDQDLLVDYLFEPISENHPFIVNEVIDCFWNFPEDLQEKLRQKFKNISDTKNPILKLPDDFPF